MNLYDIQAGSPHAVYLLWGSLSIFFLYAFYLRWKARQSILLYGSEKMAQGLVKGYTATQQWSRIALLIAVWIAATIALMAPRGNPHYPSPLPSDKHLEASSLRLPQQRVVFIIDASASMLAQDTTTKVTRFTLAKNLAEEIISNLQGGLFLSLYAFTASVVELSPPTNDYFFVRMMLEELPINPEETSGTSFDSVVAFMSGNLKKAGQLSTSFVILSDGGDNEYESGAASSLDTYIEKLVNPLKKEIAKRAGGHVQLFTIAVGSEEGAVLPVIRHQGSPVKVIMEKLFLEDFTKQIGGQFFVADAISNIVLSETVAAAIQRQTAQGNYLEEKARLPFSNVQPLFDDYFRWPLLLALLAFIGSEAFLLKKIRSMPSLALIFNILLIFSSCSDEKTAVREAGEAAIARQLNFAAAEASLNRFDSAIERYAFLLAQPHLSDRMRALLLYNLSIIELKQGAWESARNYFLSSFSFLKKAQKEKRASFIEESLYTGYAALNLLAAQELFKNKSKGDMEWAKIAILIKNCQITLAHARTLECQLESALSDGLCAGGDLEKINSQASELIKELKEYAAARKRTGERLDAAASQEPAALAKAILAMQEGVLAEHTFKMVLDAVSLNSQELGQKQKQVVELASTFIPQAIKWQKSQFEQAIQKSSSFCLENPWKKAFPLAVRGLEAASLAEGLAKQDLQTMLWREWESWQAWHDLYELLKENRSYGGASSSANKPETSFDQVLHNLEAMEREEGKEKAETIKENSLW